jgi:hypothetical protein
LHVTDVELARWQTRRTDNVNGIGSETFQSMWNRIVSDADTFKGQSHPGADGHWEGWTNTGCIDEGAGFGPGRGAGHQMLNSAFVFLVTGDTSYAAPVRTELLQQITEIGTNFADRTRWCVTGASQKHVEFVGWSMRMIFAYDYLLAGNYTALTTQERASIATWLQGMGQFWLDDTNYIITSQRFSQGRQDPPVYTCNGWTCNCQGVTNLPPNTCSIPTVAKTHWTGNLSTWFQEGYSNRHAGAMIIANSVGVLTNHATMKLHSTWWYQEQLRFATFADGSPSDQYRWCDEEGMPNGIQSSWGHAAMQWGSTLMIADQMARIGDASLYNYQAPVGVCGAGGNNLTMLSILQHVAGLVNGTVANYGSTTSSLTDAKKLLWRPALGGLGETGDLTMALGNIWYKDAAIEQAYSRDLDGSLSDGGGYGIYGGAWNFYPDVRFMFGNNEDLDPYSLGAAPATCTVTAPTTFARYSTMADPLTTVAGTASAGTTSVAWSCPNCSTTTGTATGDETWTIASLAGWNVGDNLVTITPTDSEGPGTPCTLTVQYQTAPDPATGLIAQWPLDALAGGSTPDATGGGHTGQLTGGVSSVAGQVGNAALFDGSTGLITVSGTLGNPSAVTLSMWIKLTSVPTSTEYELLNLGNRVGLRAITGNQLRGFHYVTGNYNGRNAPGLSDTNWHHVAYTVAAGAQWWYVDGVPVLYSTDAGGIDWTGAGSTTLLGRHPDGSNWLAGTLDEVRVYSRALTGVDIAALASASTPPTCIVTTPATDPYETDTTPLASFAGTATDDVDVDHVTWTNSLGGGGTATGGESWSVSNIPLFPGGSGGMGSNVLTATAHDGDGQTGTCSVTVEYTPPPPPPSDVMGIYTGFTGAGVLRRR